MGRTALSKISRAVRRARIPFLKLPRNRIIFLCPADFHYYHILTVVNQLAKDKNFEITIVKWDTFEEKRIDNVRYIEKKTFDRECLRTYDIFCTTEFGRNPPWWVTGMIKVYFLHGVGPKASYFASDSLSYYDVLFTPGPYVKKRQLPFVNQSCQFFDIGLPITDSLITAGKNASSTSGLPELLYAPSWSSSKEYISIDEKILVEIGALKGWKVVIRPHPNLLIPSRCNGVDWGKRLKSLQQDNNHVTVHAGEGTSIYDILETADVLLTDISSVLFEFLILDRPIIFYAKEGIETFYDFQDLSDQMSDACKTIYSPDTLAAILEEEHCRPEARSAQREKLLAQTIYNPGKASEKMLSAFHQLVTKC